MVSNSVWRRFTLALAGIALCVLSPVNVWSQAAVTTNFSGNQLYYADSSGVTQLESVSPGVNPANLIFALDQLIYYTLYGSGQVGVFNPYNRSNAIVVSGLDHPQALVLEPNCKAILVTVQGLTTSKPSLARIAIPSGQMSTVPLSFTPVGLAYDSSQRLFVADSTNNNVHQIDPSTGNILNSLPTPLMSPNNQPDIPNEMTFDHFKQQLFLTSSTFGGIYQIPTNLSGYTFLASVPAPANGIVSTGGGVLAIAGADTHIYSYTIQQNKLTQLISVPGLDGLALVPAIGCPLGTSNCGQDRSLLAWK